MYLREETKKVAVGPLVMGGDEPVRVESMTKTDTRDVGATLAQVEELAAAGCELVRAAVPDEVAARAFAEFSRRAPIPVVADVHFDYRLALTCLAAGACGIRWNPGNITREEHVAEVAREIKSCGASARVGVNAGSLGADVVAAHGGRTAAAMAATALAAVKRLEALGVDAIIISAKATSPAVTLRANELIAAEVAYPLHVGVTEAGFGDAGIVRSAAGISLVLAAGLGNSIRVSLTDAPRREVGVAYEILRAFELRRRGPTLISCPGCGRLEVDVASLARRVAAALAGDRRDVTVAVMGCAVNGPGEARAADVGIAGGKGRGVVYRRGELVRVEDEGDLVAALCEELDKLEATDGCCSKT